MFTRVMSFVIAMMMGVAAFAGSYTFSNMQYGPSNNHTYRLKFYEGVLVNGQPEYQLRYEEQYILTGSVPEWGIYQYEAAFNYTPAGGNQFASTLIEIWDETNNLLLDNSQQPTWVP